jgi:hypothetical protein
MDPVIMTQWRIVNITIVDDFLNKRLIRDKTRSVYMEKFNNDNKELAKTMATHPTPDPEH